MNKKNLDYRACIGYHRRTWRIISNFLYYTVWLDPTCKLSIKSREIPYSFWERRKNSMIHACCTVPLFCFPFYIILHFISLSSPHTSSPLNSPLYLFLCIICRRRIVSCFRYQILTLVLYRMVLGDLFCCGFCTLGLCCRSFFRRWG